MNAVEAVHAEPPTAHSVRTITRKLSRAVDRPSEEVSAHVSMLVRACDDSLSRLLSAMRLEIGGVPPDAAVLAEPLRRVLSALADADLIRPSHRGSRVTR